MSTDADPAESEAFQRVCESLVEDILTGDVGRDDLESAKMDACREHSSPKVPKNTELLDSSSSRCSAGA